MHRATGPHDLPTVLLIDDDLVSREVAATLLTLSGYTVHTVVDGASAVERLAAGTVLPDVILMDAQMPGLSGTQLIAELRARSRALLYVISGSGPAEEIAAAADGVLLKPFDAEALGKLLEGADSYQAPSFLDPQEPVVNVQLLAQLRRMMPESGVRQIYDAVVKDLTQRIVALGTAVGQGDLAAVRRIGHAIKGGCAMAGAQQAARLGALLETIPGDTESNQLDNSAALLRDLRAATEALERMLKDELPA